MGYKLHEVLEVHEIAAFKTVCMTKSKTMNGLVSDPGLKNILRQDAELSTRQLEQLQSVLASASKQELNGL